MSLKELLPEYIFLGASTYKVIPRDAEWMELSTCAGQCRWPAMEVDVVYDQAPSEVANTLIHEALHLCYREWQIKPKCGEERTVTALGYALTALYAQNPDLFVSIDALVNYQPTEE